MKTKNKNCKTLYLEGMHCPACELIVEKELGKLDGIKKVKASLKDKKVEIEFKDLVGGEARNEAIINDRLKSIGYTAQNTPPGIKYDSYSIQYSVAIVFFIIFGWMFLENTGMISMKQFDISTPFAPFILGLVAGLSSCGALVGGLLLALSKQWTSMHKANSLSAATPFVLFNIGRIVSFIVLGGVLGIIGSWFQISITATSVLSIFLAFVMALLGLQMIGVSLPAYLQPKVPKKLGRYITNEKSFTGKYMPFVAGALTFFIPCGFTIMAQALALVSGNFITSATIMGMFALGTLPVLGAISYSSVRFQTDKQFSQIYNLSAGLLVIIFALYTFNSQLNVLGLPSINDVTKTFIAEKIYSGDKVLGVSEIKENNIVKQLLTIEAVGFDYFPKAIQLKSGVPVKMEILNSGSVGCAQAMSAQGLYPDVIYLEGEKTIVEFTPEKPGNYKITCSMGMVDPVAVTVL